MEDFSSFVLEEYMDDSELEVVLSEMDESALYVGHRTRSYIHRDFVEAERILFDDYLGDNPRYNDRMFLRRFRMTKEMFWRISDGLKNHDFFKQKIDAVGKRGLSTVQKVCAAVRMLAYGTSSDSVDEYLKMGDSTAMLCLKEFCSSILSDSSKRAKKEGFPVCLVASTAGTGSGTSHKCPTAYKGQFTGKEGKATIVLEAIASSDTHIWHSFFGSPGSLNDINILDRSPLVNNIVNGGTLDAKYRLNGKQRHQGYLLADGIYPDWAVFVKTISNPKNAKEKLFSKLQESYRKDVERAFGIMVKCFHILAYPARLFDVNVLKNVLQTCIILHNMRVELKISTEQDHEQEEGDEQQDLEVENGSAGLNSVDALFQQYCSKRVKIKDTQESAALRHDLVDHAWQHFGCKS
ncbi:uncharacterized protein LOC128745822 [Sabethes cyaneus]|uniref:uncharacterized protein LOC128745822 n=1 Tax=Sabethes cyaneus TaxID=53552 RepID=UPI00237D7785|nr:uncharacterized protein LOC128745822 [Sabethes cyaneus]